jgi:hypothetical protein
MPGCIRTYAPRLCSAASVRNQHVWQSNRVPIALHRSSREVLVRADGDKEIKDVPGGEKKQSGGSLPSFLKPLTDFGVGRTSVWEGGVGLFILVGAGKSNSALHCTALRSAVPVPLAVLSVDWILCIHNTVHLQASLAPSYRGCLAFR